MSSSHPVPQQYLGVSCQNCGEIIPVPAHVLDRQIAIAEDPSDARHQYVSTLLNLRCLACFREYFYDVDEIVRVEESPQPVSAATAHPHSVHPHAHAAAHPSAHHNHLHHHLTHA